MIAPAFITTVPHDLVERLVQEKEAGDQRAAAAVRVLSAYPARMEGVPYAGRLMDGPDGKPFFFFLGGPVVVVAWSVS